MAYVLPLFLILMFNTNPVKLRSDRNSNNRNTFLCPEIVERAAAGELPVGLSSNLARKTIPDSWAEQMEMLAEE